MSTLKNGTFFIQHSNSDFLEKSPPLPGFEQKLHGTKPMRYQFSYPGLNAELQL